MRQIEVARASSTVRSALPGRFATNAAANYAVPGRARSSAGRAARLDVMRNGETRHIDVTVGEFKNAKAAAADVAGQDHGRLGVVVRED